MSSVWLAVRYIVFECHALEHLKLALDREQDEENSEIECYSFTGERHRYRTHCPIKNSCELNNPNWRMCF